MKKSELKFTVELDNANVPEKITWTADDKPAGYPDTTNAMALSLWDEGNNSIFKMDLWTKDLKVGEMKRFFVQSIAGLNESVMQATNDDILYQKVKQFCDELGMYVVEDERKNN